MNTLCTLGQRVSLWLICFGFSVLSAQTIHPDYQDGRLYVKLSAQSSQVLGDVSEVLADRSLSDLHSLVQAYGITSIQRPVVALHTPFFDRVYAFRFEEIAESNELMAALSALPWVEYAERVPLYRTHLIPNDTLWAQVANHLTLIQADLAWDLHTGGGTVIAIVDNAVQASHPDLASNMWVNPGEIPGNGIDDDNNGYIDDVNGYDVSDDDGNVNPPNASLSHGTHCAGIASAATDNGSGIASVGHSCRIMGVKATGDNDNPLFIQNSAEGVSYAIAAGADVVSMSYGGGGSSQTLEELFAEGHRRGIMFISSAGNDNDDQLKYPAGYPHVMAVASTTVQDQRSGFSNFGTWVDIAAPGSNILSTVPIDSYAAQSGTSMACPMAAGLLGLMKSYRPGLSTGVYEYVMRQSSDNIDSQNPNYIGLLGAGRINAFQALREITNCYPLASSTEGPRIDSTQIDSYQGTPLDSCARYTFEWEDVIYLTPEDLIPLGLKVGTCGPVNPRQLAVFVDWNADGDFSDSLERVWEVAPFAGDSTLSDTLSIPSLAALEQAFRLRIIVREGSGQIDPCQDYGAGETQDYNLYLLPPVCPQGSVLISEFPFEEDFEAFAPCDTTPGQPCHLSQGWTNQSDDDLDWIAHQGLTPTPNTGPSVDFVPADLNGTYLYLEASNAAPETEAYLVSPCLDLSAISEPEITFAYHMYGGDMGQMRLEIRGDGLWETMWSSAGNRQNLWRLETLDLSEYAGQVVRIRFIGIVGPGPRSDMALGFINLGDRQACGGETALRLPAGQIEDGSGLWRNYRENADCRWLIQPYNTQRIRVAFDRFRSLPQQDYLRAHDGENLLAPELVAYSGFSADSLLVEGGSLYLRFTSDAALNQDGFLLHYQTEPLPDVLAYGLPTRSGLAGQLLRIPLQVRDFTDLYQASARLYLADTSVARFVSGTFLAPGVGGSLSATFSDDSLTLNWLGNPNSPVTLPDGDTLAYLQLRLTGDIGDSTALWLPTGQPDSYQAKRRIGTSNLSLLLPKGDSSFVKIADPNVGLSPQALPATSLQVSPNPFEQVAQLQVQVPAAQSGTLRICDAMGRVMWQQALAPQSGVQVLTVSSATWAQGLYVCTLTTPQGVASRKIWRQASR
jgi:subtilisin family serine protease